MTTAAPQAEVLAKLQSDVNHFLKLSELELFDLDYQQVQKIQLHHLKNSFARMRPKIRAVDRLASSTGVDAINTVDDVVPLCFPHTMYKSYSLKDLEEQRFDRLTKWLGTVTALDLTKVDLSGCDSLESWLSRIESSTTLRPLTSSGTSGKISIFPRSELEESTAFLEMVLRGFDPYKDEPAVNFRSGAVPLIFPWPNDKGRHNIPTLFRILRQHVYGGREDAITTVGKGVMTADEMLLAGKLRRAEARGEPLDLSPREREIAQQMALRTKRAGERWPEFVREVVAKHRGQVVVLYGPWFQVYQLAKYCKDNNIAIEWSPDSLLMSGGGTKGNQFPAGWRELIDEMIPFSKRYRETYSFTECTANAILCSHGHLHPHPWGIPFVIDPDTSAPLPRTGTQTGRCAFFDLIPTTYWGGTITGDEVTMNWDGGCACGRKGPYFLNNIRRYIETRDGDDKITCSKTPDAYDKLVEFSMSLEG